MPVDIAHITFRGADVPGSFNRTVAAQLRGITAFRQVMVSYQEPGARTVDPGPSQFLQVPRCSSAVRLALKCTGMWRQGETRIHDPDRFAFARGVMRCLNILRPRLVICYDEHKLGQMLRRNVAWPCRLVLSQRGHSYHLVTSGAGRRLYSLEAFDAVITLSLSAYRYDAARLHAYEPAVYVIPSCVNTDEFAPVDARRKAMLRAEFGFQPNEDVVLCLSRQVPKKGAHLLVESWPRILRVRPRAILWIVGPCEPEYRARLETTARRLGIEERVRVHGAVDPDRTARCYQAADLYVFPTLCHEGHGKSLLEAMACGRACISSAFEAATEHYSPDEVILVPHPNVTDAFVEPILRVLDCTELRCSLSQAGRRAVVRRFSEETVFPLLEQFYRRQLEMVTG